MTVIITGAAGGIGRATSFAFLAEGARIVAADIDDSALERLTGDAPAGSSVLPLPGDITDKKYCKHLIQTAIAKTGRLDVLVNNAG